MTIRASRFERIVKAYRTHRTERRAADLRLLEGVREVAARHNARRLQQRGSARRDFNLFHLLGIGRREVKTHSAMLAGLLSPRGFHGQGNLFLRAMLAVIWQRGGLTIPLPSVEHDGDWIVECERVTDVGRLDLVLENCAASVAIVIENKVDAPDQVRQMSRYGDWQGRVQGREFETCILAYLSPDGRPPRVRSSTSLAARLVLVSYRQDIAPALEKVIGEIGSEEVCFFVRQYADLVRRL